MKNQRLNVLGRKVNSMGLTEYHFANLKEQQEFLEGPITVVGLMNGIDLYASDDVEATIDTLNVIVSYGRDDYGDDIRQHIFGNCYFATVDENGKTVELSKDQVATLIEHSRYGYLKANNNRIMNIDMSAFF